MARKHQCRSRGCPNKYQKVSQRDAHEAKVHEECGIDGCTDELILMSREGGEHRRLVHGRNHPYGCPHERCAFETRTAPRLATHTATRHTSCLDLRCDFRSSVVLMSEHLDTHDFQGHFRPIRQTLHPIELVVIDFVFLRRGGHLDGDGLSLLLRLFPLYPPDAMREYIKKRQERWLKMSLALVGDDISDDLIERGLIRG